MEDDAERDRITMRLRIIDALLRAIEAGPALLEAVRASVDTTAARRALMAEPWNFDESVVMHVIDMPYRRTTQRGYEDLQRDAAELRDQLSR